MRFIFTSVVLCFVSCCLAQKTNVDLFQLRQDSLRKVLLSTMQNENLKNSLLEELYIKGLVKEENKKIVFNLNFNLHGYDCGAPDCYSTDISFQIPATNPVSFPKNVDLQLSEHGCNIEKEILQNGTFTLVEATRDFVNYYSKKLRSNLIILGQERKLFYFPDTDLKGLMVSELRRKISSNEEDEIETYMSSAMRSNEYEYFLQQE